MKVCILGLGYIGLPTAIMTSLNGLDVLGVDINPEIVDKTNRGELHIAEPGLEKELKAAVKSGRLKAAIQPEISDVYLIVVPTPFKLDHQPDLSFVNEATRSIIPLLKNGDVVILESTSPVGTTEEIAGLIFNQRPDLKDKISVAYCPERVLPGNVIHELINNDRVIGGIDLHSTEQAIEFYKTFVKGDLYPTDSKTAEMCKLAENSSRDVQIAYANELSLICDEAGINVWELINLANKHPRVNILQPGCGVGGHCIAVDPYFITTAFPHESKLIATARSVNNYKSEWCTERIINEILKFEIENKRKPVVALMGIAFKPDIDDLRESPAKAIVSNVVHRCASVSFLIAEPNIREHSIFKLTPYQQAYQQADIVVFLTRHTPFLQLRKEVGKIILDFCGVFKN